jgi:hypothetical protein
MRRDEESVWMVIGGLGSMALGIAPIPLRALTSASNLAFVVLMLTSWAFVVWLVATAYYLGGTRAAFKGPALCSGQFGSCWALGLPRSRFP